MMSFTYPWFLAGMAAAGIPLALHLMRRQITRDLLFPSIRFIRKGPVPKKGKRRLRDIFLLLLRMAFLILLALFFAAPFQAIPPGPPVGDATRPRMVLVDVSASMAAKGKKDQLLTAVKKMAGEQSNQRFQVIVSANGVVKTSPVLTPAAFIDYMRGLRVGTAAGNPEEAVRQAARQLKASPGASLCILSDFQLTDWAGEAFPKMPPGTHLELIPIDSPTHNLSIQSARPFREADNTLRVQVDIRNDGPDSRSIPVSLIVGGDTISKTVDCPARESKTISLSLKDPASDIGVVQLPDDDFNLDNSFYLWLGAPAARQLVAVLSEKDKDTPLRELYFIRKALSIQPLNSRFRFAITQAPTTSFFALDLSNVDGLLLLGAAAHLEDPGFNQVKTFLNDGGTVFCTLSPTSPARQFLALKKHGLLTADFRGIIAEQPNTEAPLAISTVDPTTPVGKLFAGVEDSDLFFMAIRKMARFSAYLPAKAVFSTQENDPFLVHQQVGKGTFYFLAVPLITAWTDLPVSLSFLPMIQEIFTPPSSLQGVVSLACGSGLPARSDLSGEKIVLNKPGWDNTAFDAPPQAGKIGSTPVEINVSRQESSPLTRPLTAIRLALTGTPWDQRQLTQAAPQGGKRDLRPFVAALLLMVILLETLVAARLKDRGA